MISWIRNFLFSFEPVFRYYCRYYWRPRVGSIQHYLRALANERKDVFFVQVGANDGVVNDPVYRFIIGYNWRGLLIEPQKIVFSQQLQETFSGRKGLILENVAISDSNEDRELFKIAFSGKRWATGLATFIRSKLEHAIASGYVRRCAEKHNEVLPASVNNFIASEFVKCRSFDFLFNKHGITHVDALIIDVEGYDYEILKLFNFDIFKPSIVCYEHKHLSDSDSASSGKFMEAKGYLLIRDRHDTICVLVERVCDRVP